MEHSGSDLTGAGQGDGEHIDMNFAGAETATVSGELYRYQDEWKSQAAGRGHASDLAGIAMDLGIDI